MGPVSDDTPNEQAQMSKVGAPNNADATPWVALRYVLTEEDLKDKTESSYVADDTRQKCAQDLGAVEYCVVVHSLEEGADVDDRVLVEPLVGCVIVEFKDTPISVRAAH